MVELHTVGDFRNNIYSFIIRNICVSINSKIGIQQQDFLDYNNICSGIDGLLLLLREVQSSYLFLDDVNLFVR